MCKQMQMHFYINFHDVSVHTCIVRNWMKLVILLPPSLRFPGWSSFLGGFWATYTGNKSFFLQPSIIMASKCSRSTICLRQFKPSWGELIGFHAAGYELLCECLGRCFVCMEIVENNKLYSIVIYCTYWGSTPLNRRDVYMWSCFSKKASTTLTTAHVTYSPKFSCVCVCGIVYIHNHRSI